ncbi:hypothetical protein OIU74_011324 [Salix koriyanagi]|uniref:Uncharacterized protein n=1 Tax=Salix koriyanagi TaxID=2511006 RepID=A0A9Q0TEZ1_9ROSI|nr:hypothetical protein OIU74_011324 [Salix koriyanagi]
MLERRIKGNLKFDRIELTFKRRRHHDGNALKRTASRGEKNGRVWYRKRKTFEDSGKSGRCQCLWVQTQNSSSILETKKSLERGKGPVMSR